MTTIKTLRDALESLYQMTARYAITDADYGIVCNAAAVLEAATKDAPALEAVPVHFYRMPAGSGQWIETTAGCIEAIKGMMQHYPYEFRTLYTAPAKQEAAPFEAQEGLTKAAIAWWKNHRPCNWTEAQHVENPVVNCQSGADEELAVQVAAIIATKQSPAAPTNAKESK
jgi:hypothetical protein